VSYLNKQDVDKNVTKVSLDAKSLYQTSIDIIIPYYNQYNSVLRSIRSIFSVPTKHKIKIILVDDHSENVSFLENFENNKYVDGYRMPQRSGFGASVNFGLKKCESPWILVCHSDIEASHTGWIDNLIESILNWKKVDDSVKMVSACTNIVPDDVDSSLKRSNVMEGKDFILDSHSPFYATLFHRDLPKHIGGNLFKEYPIAWYEDIELSSRMKYYGYKQSGSSKSFVRHYGGLTINALLSSQEGGQIGKTMESNYQKCTEDVNNYHI